MCIVLAFSGFLLACLSVDFCPSTAVYKSRWLDSSSVCLAAYDHSHAFMLMCVCVFPVHINLTNTNCAHPMKGQKPTPDVFDVYIEFLVK